MGHSEVGRLLQIRLIVRLMRILNMRKKLEVAIYKMEIISYMMH
jgi:hypothetical protein